MAASVETEYLRHARKLDRRILGITAEEQAAGARGPVENKLREFGRTQGFVTGTFNEGSPDLHTHLTLVARAKAREWRYLGARSYAECLGVITSSLYRKWGAAIANANAQLRMTRLEVAGARGPGARAYGVRDGVCAGLAWGARFARRHVRRRGWWTRPGPPLRWPGV